MLTSRGLPSDSTCVLKAEPGNLDTCTWYSIYQITHCFTLQTRDYDVIFDFCIDSAYLATSFKHDLVKAHAVR